MCAPSTFGPPGREVVRVVLHERGAAVEAGAHHLRDRGRARPSSSRPRRRSRSRRPSAAAPRCPAAACSRAEILERVGEGLEAARLEERAQARLDPRRVAQRLAPLAARAQRRGELVRVLVLRDEPVDLRVGDGARPRRRARRRRSRSPRRRAGSAPRPCRPR